MKRWIVLAALAGCGGHAKPVSIPSLEVDAAAIDKAVRAQIETQDDALADLDADAWAALLAPDAIVLGSGPDEVWVGHTAAAAALHSHFDPARAAGAAANTSSRDREVSVAPDGKSAWVAEQLDFTLSSGGMDMLVPFRETELFANLDGEWKVVVAALSVAVPVEQAMDLAKSGDWPALAAIPGGIGDGGDDIYATAAHDLDHVGTLIASFSDRDDALVIGPATEQVARGGDDIKQRFASAWPVEMKRDGDLRVGAAPGGDVGWVLANVTVTMQDVTQPMRAMLVYLRESGKWHLVQAHFSNGVPPQGAQ